MLSGGTLTGAEVDAMSDAELGAAAREASIFARVSPEQKARIIRLLRQSGGAVGFMGDGVNDALALHEADIGISVDSATDVAKDAADVVLLDKDLGVLAEGVMEGRRIFANTIKYVLMGTSSNFGNMFSAATASVVLSFLPMLPGQILLNNLLYDTGQLAIPGDRVDKEQLLAPSHWNIGFIRRFMFLFGPISSLFDFATFALMLFAFDAVPGEFRAGWFIESIATQTLIIFAIRTRRVPFFRSRPSVGLAGASLGRGGTRDLPPALAAGRSAGLRSASRPVLPCPAGDDRGVPGPGGNRQALVLLPGGAAACRSEASRRAAPRQDPPHRPPGRTLQYPGSRPVAHQPRPGAAAKAQNRAQRPSPGHGVRRIVEGSGHRVHSRACGIRYLATAVPMRPTADVSMGSHGDEHF